MAQSVAVVIPSFNRAHCLQRALDSVLAQTRIADEIIVIDDGSEDATADLLARNYPSVRYHHQSNQGVSAARNKGIELSAAQYVAFLDSDDEWLPRKLELQLQAVEHSTRYQLVHCDEIWIRNGKRVNPMAKHRKRGGDIFSHCLPRCVISPSAVMMHRDLFSRYGAFNESLPACEDYDLWLRLCSQIQVLYLEQPLLKKYGGHEDQLSRKHWGMDRFRIQALQELLEGGSLNQSQRGETRAMLLEKCRILLLGAEKRKNIQLVEYCQGLQEKYQHQRRASAAS